MYIIRVLSFPTHRGNCRRIQRTEFMNSNTSFVHSSNLRNFKCVEPDFENFSIKIESEQSLIFHISILSNCATFKMIHFNINASI